MTSIDVRDEIVVADVGARFGIHPTWAEIDVPLDYHMIEADPAEAERLKVKYADSAQGVTVHGFAAGREPGATTLNILAHRGLSSTKRPNPESAWFKLAHPEDGKIVDKVEIEVRTLDDLARTSEVKFDFIKCDAEGGALDVFHGASEQLERSVLGVRSEIEFAAVFEDCATFGEVDAFLAPHRFVLLNIETLGKRSPVNPYFLDDNFGFLETAEAIWIKSFDTIAEEYGWKPDEVVTAALKLAVFSFRNGATDVAVQYLLDASETYGSALEALCQSALYRSADRSTQYLFKTLDAHPAFDERGLDATYQSIFGGTRKKRHEFFEDLDLNP